MGNGNYWTGKRVLVTGGAGFLGSYVVENLTTYRDVPREAIVVPRSSNCDLRHPANCESAVRGCDVVIHLAAVTGGISFSRAHPASQYYDSTMIDLNMVEAARRAGVKKFVAIGNVFAYASDAPVPLVEESLFNGLPTDAHRGVGWMKRNLALVADLYHRQFGFSMVVVYSANGYGPRDSTDRNHAHVIPATIMKCFHEKELVVWGDGTPSRDFLFAADIAEGLLLAAERLEGPQFVNIASETEITVRQLVDYIVKFSEFQGAVTFDVSKAGGDARRSVSAAKARDVMGFKPRIPMADGLEKTVAWYRAQLEAK